MLIEKDGNGRTLIEKDEIEKMLINKGRKENIKNE